MPRILPHILPSRHDDALLRGAGEAVEAFLFYLSKMKERLPALEPLWEGEEKLILIRDQEGNSWKDHMVDVRDLVHGLIGALDKAETFGQVFHLRDPEHLHGKRWSRISASPWRFRTSRRR